MGGYSQVNLTLDMLEESTKGNYVWYHFIGGTSLPIKTQDEVHYFFDNDFEKKLYFHINIGTFKLIQDRAKAYYPFIESKSFRKSKLLKLISIVIGKIQILFGVNRLKDNELAPLYNGWSWFSIPDDFAKYLLMKRELLEKTFKYTLASDEVWLHSVAAHSNKYRSRTYGLNGRDDPLDATKHFQDWKRGKPYVFHKEDYSLLMEDNPCFWARKFDENVDKEIVDMIFEEIKRRQEIKNGFRIKR